MISEKIGGELHQKLVELLDGYAFEFSDYLGDLSVCVELDQAKEILAKLKNSSVLNFNQMIDLTCVDYLQKNRSPRFDVVYHLFSLGRGYRLRVKVGVDDNKPMIDTVSDLWLAANWYERECFDLFGIHFNNHPDLRRIIMWEGFDGHPLRKDYPITKEQPLVDLKEAPERYQYMNKHLF